MGLGTRPYPINQRFYSRTSFRRCDWKADFGRSNVLSASSLSKSLTIPAQLAAALGEAGMDVQLSVYLTE
jgi:hypothetical protein